MLVRSKIQENVSRPQFGSRAELAQWIVDSGKYDSTFLLASSKDRFVRDYRELRSSSADDRSKNRSLTELMSRSDYIGSIFDVIRRPKRSPLLLGELKSVTYRKILTRKNFLSADRRSICDLLFVAISNNWRTVLERDRRYRNKFGRSLPADFDIAEKSTEPDNDGVCVTLEGGRLVYISDDAVHQAMRFLEKIDPICFTCLELKLYGMTESEIGINLGLGLYCTRARIRRAKSELRTILVQQAENRPSDFV